MKIFTAALLFIFVKSICTEVALSRKLDDCRYDIRRLYLMEGQLVEWSASVQGHVWVNGCVNNTLLEENLGSLDMDVIGKYAYKELSVHDTIWPTMPDWAQTKEVYLGGGVTPFGVWGGCSELAKLEIQAPINLTLMSPDWLSNCTRLIELRLVDLNLEQIRQILNSVTKVTHVALVKITDIEDIMWNPVFPLARRGHEWINRLDVDIIKLAYSNDSIWLDISESFVRQLALLPRLEEIFIMNFINLDWCASSNNSGVTFGSLKVLILQNTATSRLCFKELRVAPNLTRLSVIGEMMKFSELLSTCAPQMNVQWVNSLVFTREDFYTLLYCEGSQRSNITFGLDWVSDCDCGQSLWLTKALLEGFVTFAQAACLDGSALKDAPCDWLYCDRIICNTTCICCDDKNGGLIADCRGANVTQIPEDVLNLTNLTEILIPNSDLIRLPENIPSSVSFLDLSGNDLFRDVDASDITALFTVPERTVRLAANSIVCTCVYEDLIKAIQNYRNQIEDYDEIVCAGQNGKLKTVDVAILCADRDQAATRMMVVSIALVAAITALTLAVTLYYRRQIQIFMYARGWCLCCINEEELDSDRRYDVFLSYCYADEELVVNELLTKLDQEYSVCVHFRDWNPGDMIPAQIWKSVGDSRRTVVILSRNFVKSLWGLLEFRSAYVSGLTEGRARVVMVVLDDVLEEENLVGELRAYVRLNTYVKWGDPWFWDKLRFALPHRPMSREPEHRNPDSQYYIVNEPLEMLAINGLDNSAYVEGENVLVVQNGSHRDADSVVSQQRIADMVNPS